MERQHQVTWLRSGDHTIRHQIRYFCGPLFFSFETRPGEARRRLGEARRGGADQACVSFCKCVSSFATLIPKGNPQQAVMVSVVVQARQQK